MTLKSLAILMSYFNINYDIKIANEPIHVPWIPESNRDKNEQDAILYYLLSRLIRPKNIHYKTKQASNVFSYLVIMDITKNLL